MKACIKAKNPDAAQSVIDMILLYLSKGKAWESDCHFAQNPGKNLVMGYAFNH